MTLLALRGVVCMRGGRTLFEGLDLMLAAGDAAVVTGPNGVGKSSLIRIAAGLLRPAAGDVAAAPAALVDERASLDPERTLAEALRFWMAIDRASSATPVEAGDQSGAAREIPQRPPSGPRPSPGWTLEEALDLLDLAALADVPVRLLSTGQRRRAALARVAVSPARLWLLDEPANGLDDAAVARLALLVAAHRAGGGAVLVATHLPLDLPGGAAIRLEAAA